MGSRVRGLGGCWVVLGVVAACSGKTLVQTEKADGAGGTNVVSYGGAGGQGAADGTGGISGALGRGGAVGRGGAAGSSGAAGSGTTGGSAGVFSGGSGGVLGAGGTAFDGGSCASMVVEADPRPLDLLLLLDRSESMLGHVDRWFPVTNAIRAFAQSPRNAGVSLGLNYFGLHPGGPPVDPADPGSCDPNEYVRPEVPIDVLPNGAHAIVESLTRNQPAGARPTRPALTGALLYASRWAITHPDHRVAVVLATDGAPQGCTDNDLTTVAELAAAGLAANPSIPTYVIRIGNVQGLDAVAAAGGTGQAFVVPDLNVNQRFLDALQQIAGPTLGCTFTLPATSTQIDPTKVNVFHTPAGGARSVIYAVSSAADCRPDEGGWYYLRNAASRPIAIELCPVSCQRVTDGGGSIEIELGCASVPPP
jgi:hypothetical protein